MTQSISIYPGVVNLTFESLSMMISSALSDSTKETASERAWLERRFSEIIESYQGILKRICFSFSNSGSDYDDLRQDVLINIWKGLHTFREESEPSTWIYRIAFNSCVSTLRKEKIKSKERDSLFEHVDIASEDSSETRENIETLHYLISCLNPEERAIILMWLDEKKYEEIAEVIGIPRNTVATRIRRIKEKLSRINQKEQ